MDSSVSVQVANDSKTTDCLRDAVKVDSILCFLCFCVVVFLKIKVMPAARGVPK